MLSAHGGLRIINFSSIRKNSEIELRVLALCYPGRLASGADCGGGHYANASSLYLLSPSLLCLSFFHSALCMNAIGVAWDSVSFYTSLCVSFLHLSLNFVHFMRT